jgi:hypothetical protein
MDERLLGLTPPPFRQLEQKQPLLSLSLMTCHIEIRIGKLNKTIMYFYINYIIYHENSCR